MSLQSALRLLAHVEGPLLAARIDDGVIVTANRPFAGLVGYSQAELIGSSIETLAPTRHDGPTLGRAILKEDGPLEALAIRTASGSTLTVGVWRWHLASSSISPLCALALEHNELATRLAEVLASKHLALQQSHAELQQVCNRLELQKDELDLRHREQAILHSKLARSMRLAAIGEMSAGLAHTIRNPLAAVSAALGRLERSLSVSAPDAAQCLQIVNRAQKACNRIGTIVERFQRLSPSTRPGSAPSCLLNEEVEAVLELVAHRQGPGIRVEVEIPRGIRVSASSEDLHLIVSNLIDNALNAIGDSGIVRLTAAACGEMVVLHVEDNGPGIAPDVRDRLFDPFVTTRLDGCGIGLSLVRAAAERSGGSVSLNSSLGEGASFEVRLPAATGGAKHEHAEIAGR